MDEGGVMQEVREVLSAGAAPREAIAMGYAPGTVYKVNRQMERAGERGRALVPAVSSPMSRNDGPAKAPLGDRTRGGAEAFQERLAGLEEEVRHLRAREEEQGRASRAAGERTELLARIVLDLVFLTTGLPMPCTLDRERKEAEALERLVQRVWRLEATLPRPAFEPKAVICNIGRVRVTG